MLGVFIVPTGIGAEIGGHSGDATPAAKLIAAACDKLIVHPNVVNASDINEMTENMLYVEGSMLDRYLNEHINLYEVRSNRILVATNPPIKNEIINAVSAARATIGADIKILALQEPLVMEAHIKNGVATGNIYGVEALLSQIRGCKYAFDVLVVSSQIKTDDDDVKSYLECDGGINLWGGVEAKLSKILSKELNKPVFHAPIENSEFFKTYNEVSDPRKAAEMVSTCYLHCCLKGAHKAPIIRYSGESLPAPDFMVTPHAVWGPPHKACRERHIPIITVLDNRTVLNDATATQLIYAENYLEAAGIVLAMKQGLTLESIRRPLKATEILR